MTIRIEEIHTDAAVDAWLLLFANRDDVAVEYAALLRGNGSQWPGWSRINAAILRRWSMAGLRYIKERAWKLAAAAPAQETP